MTATAYLSLGAVLSPAQAGVSLQGSLIELWEDVSPCLALGVDLNEQSAI